MRNSSDEEVYDYVVVGAGSAGSALANRLTACGRYTVLVLEAGGPDRSPWIHIPIGYGKIFHDAAVNWKYVTEPSPGLDYQRTYWPRGKVLGGSSSINAMVHVRGHPRDYAEWNSAAAGWDWEDVAPVFRRLEDWDGPANENRGIGGPIAVHDVSQEVHPLTRAYLEAADQAGLGTSTDYNSGDMDGATLYQIATKGGFRASAARGYLRPARRRSNLNVQTKAHVARVLLADKRAVGVEYMQDGQSKTARVRGEVILCGGAINSPQLLQLSGIGPTHVLKHCTIPVVHDAAQVGRNLKDHLGCDLYFRSRVPTLNQQLRPLLGKLMVGLQYLLTRKGPLSLSLNQGGGFVRMSEQSEGPDVQVYFSPVSYTRAPVGVRPLMSPDPFPGFLLGFNPCKPTSTGHLQIKSPDPLAPPELHPNYLDTDHDKSIMLAGIRLMRRIASMSALQTAIETELLPGADVENDEDLAAYLRSTSWSVFHQCSTCRMGSDPATSVVDARLRVHGIERLRVADASIFPTIPTGNTNAPAIMVGERASDLILQDAMA